MSLLVKSNHKMSEIQISNRDQTIFAYWNLKRT